MKIGDTITFTVNEIKKKCVIVDIEPSDRSVGIMNSFLVVENKDNDKESFCVFDSGEIQDIDGNYLDLDLELTKTFADHDYPDLCDED